MVSPAGVMALTKVLGCEWAQYNINVNALAPGVTITPVNEKYYEKHPQELKEFINLIPKANVGHTADYVGTAIFLASDASNYVTGHTLVVDGGYTIW